VKTTIETTTLSAQLAVVFEQLVRQRRATPHFSDEPVPAHILDEAFTLAAQAPSGYNLQPWRFLTLRTAESRAALRRAAYDQTKITEAPVVIIAFATRSGWKSTADEILHEKFQRLGLGEAGVEKIKQMAFQFVASLTEPVWLNRQTMIAFTYLMLAIESLGWDTAPMEGFDSMAVKSTFSLPDDTDVVALLAVGRALEPKTPYPGRLAISQFVFDERYGKPWRKSSDES